MHAQLVEAFQRHSERADRRSAIIGIMIVVLTVAGVLILIKPNILNYVVGIYLILIGLLDSGILRILSAY